MVWRQLLDEARGAARGWIGDAIAHRRDHPLIYAIAHAKAATWYRRASSDHRASGKRVPAWWSAQRARYHRMRRRHFERLALATAEAEQCACAMEKLAGL